MDGTDDAKLRKVLISRRQACVNYTDDEYSKNRKEALRFYRGDIDNAYGDNEPGMSQVVSRDTMEAVESMLPGLVEPFLAGDELVRFEPTGPEDEESAQQATDYINYLFQRQNDGFQIVTTAMKDGLMFRLGVGKVVYETLNNTKTENYEGLTQEQYDMLGQEDEVKVSEAFIGEQGIDCTVERNVTSGKVKVYPVAPNEFRFESSLARLEDATFLAHETRRAIADLVDMGLDADKCRALKDEDDVSGERADRFDETNKVADDVDDDSRMVSVTECYVKMAKDGNMCWYRCFLAGSSDELLSSEKVDDHPFVVWTPVSIPHKMVGLSIHDLTRDIQLLKTALWRETMNNLYLTNRPMREVLEGKVNIDDLLTPRVGGVVRVKQLGAVREMTIPLAAAGSFQMIEYADTVREQRTGSTRYNQGMDADSLNKTATGISAIMSAAGQRSKMIARQFGDQFLKPLFRKMLELVSKNQDQQAVIRLRGEWVDMDPRDWSNEFDMTVTVGLGTGDKTKMVQDINNLLLLDERIITLQGGADGPLVTYDNIYAKLKQMAEAMGLKGVERYYTDPANAPPQQEQEQGPPIELQKEQIKADSNVKVAEINAMAEVEKAQYAPVMQ